MMSKQKFFRCRCCGNLIGLINDAGTEMVCCGGKMEKLIPNTAEAETEKHIPALSVLDVTITVKVGSIFHPMLEEHHIEFIYLQTENGGQRKSVRIGTEPVAVFKTVEDKPLEVFAYCNLHGLWKAVLELED